MDIKEAQSLGIEAAVEKSLAVMKAKTGLNAVLETVSKPDIFKAGDLNVPFLCKDNIVTLGTKTTAASKILADFTSPYEATVISRLKAAGAVLVGKTNLDEFAMGSSTENSAFGATLNPWDESRVPGGSSGGSAAAVAAGMVPLALGSDTGGSIRQPAAFCGVVGMMPTYGLVSRYGLIAMASSLDRIGPITNTVEDAARVLQVIAGWDANDSTSTGFDEQSGSLLDALDGNVKGVKIGIATEYWGEGVEAGVAEKVKAAIQKLEELGASVSEISLPHSHYALSTYYILQPAEVSANLARYDGIRYGLSKGADDQIEDLKDMYAQTRAEGFGAEAKRRIMLGTYTLSAGFRDAYYDKAQKVRTLIKRDFDTAFESVDVIISPTTPTTAFKIGERAQDPLAMYKADLLTAPANLAGIPAISVPCGLVDGLPVGMQIMGKQFGEAMVLKVAHAYEQAVDWRAE